MKVKGKDLISVPTAVARDGSLPFSARLLHGWMLHWASPAGRVKLPQTEMALRMGCSQRGVCEMIKPLVREGYIEIVPDTKWPVEYDVRVSKEV